MLTFIFKLNNVRLFIVGLFKNTARNKGSESTFNFASAWHFIEVIIPMIAIWTALLQCLTLCLLLSLGKIEINKNDNFVYRNFENFKFINSIYPRLDVSEKQIFNLSKSSQLFEIGSKESDHYLKHTIGFIECASYTSDICHYIEPITISNRNLLFANFFSSSLYKIRVISSNLNHSEFLRAHLHGAYFKDSTLKGSRLSQAVLRGSTFENTNLSGSRLHWTDFSNSSINNSNFSNLNICNTSLIDTTFYGGELSCNEVKSKYNQNKLCQCNLNDFEISSLYISQAKISGITVDFYKDDKIPVVYFNMLNNSDNFKSNIKFRGYDKVSNTKTDGVLVYELTSNKYKTEITFIPSQEKEGCSKSENFTCSPKIPTNDFVFHTPDNYVVIVKNSDETSSLIINPSVGKTEIINKFKEKISNLEVYDPNSYSTIIAILLHLADGNVNLITKTDGSNLLEELYCKYQSSHKKQSHIYNELSVQDNYISLFKDMRILNKNQKAIILKDIQQYECEERNKREVAM
ncbi:hypothetical protein JCM19236_1427 [Vibrio sp. JCM 19236]|nr:hypothetical protein JCM19236_1427 [Vibrio sp. JCM 19236]